MGAALAAKGGHWTHPSEAGARTDPASPSPLAAAHPSDPGAQKGNMKGAQRKPSFLAADHPSDSGAQKGNMKGVQREPSFFAAAHPSDPGPRKKET